MLLFVTFIETNPNPKGLIMRFLLITGLILSFSSFGYAGDEPAQAEGNARHDRLRELLREYPELRAELRETIKKWLQEHPEAREKSGRTSARAWKRTRNYASSYVNSCAANYVNSVTTSDLRFPSN
jgi:hypothetical protein